MHVEDSSIDESVPLYLLGNNTITYANETKVMSKVNAFLPEASRIRETRLLLYLS